jgi:aspartate/methionine/tyrosine aminotransferase
LTGRRGLCYISRDATFNGFHTRVTKLPFTGAGTVRLARRVDRIAPFYVMELLEKAKEMEARGQHIVHMEVGEPDFPTPPAIRQKAIEAIEAGRTFYTHSLGIPELRSAIAERYGTMDGVDIAPKRVIITNGTSGALLLLFAAFLEKESILAVSDPGYPCYRNFGELFEARILSLPVTEETGFALTGHHLESLEEAPDVLILSNPSNPTGALYGAERIEEIISMAAARGSSLIVDEIYSRLTYGTPATTALALSEDAIVVDGFSKAYAMTGWRLGWMVVPEALVRPIQKIAQNVFISPPTVSQYGALSAFTSADDVKAMRETYRSRRDFLLPELRRLGFGIPLDPEGAFYIYTDISHWGLDSMVFAERALAEARVALTPGYDFGSFRASSHVRFTYANSLEMLKLGCERLEGWLATL